MGNLRVSVAVETIDVFKCFTVVDAEIFAHRANTRLRIVIDPMDAFDDRV